MAERQAVNPMRTRRRATIEDLRLAIQCLPQTTRIAMLEGIRANEIIAGAYSNRDGICPMLAAHRAGGRTNAISFARAWDRFTLGGKKRPRKATGRELLILATQLEASLLEDHDLGSAITDHRALKARAAHATRRGDPDRTKELRRRQGWAWMRLVRRYDEYERALELIDHQTERAREIIT
jgi:hypothetical protein